MMIRFSAATHVGRVRKINEDSILSLPDQKIWVVADGMGGHAAGDYASQTIVDTIAMIEPDLPPGDLMRGLRQTILQAHSIIRDEAEAKKLGTIRATIVALILTDEHFVAFWAGDSRLYRFREGKVEMLTTDHSLVAELVLAGELTWDEAEHHPQSNAITRAVGVGDTLELDKIRGDVVRGDRFLLCSDGLTKYATSDTLEKMVVGAPIETIADSLISFALDAGGGDNISIIVIDVI